MNSFRTSFAANRPGLCTGSYLNRLGLDTVTACSRQGRIFRGYRYAYAGIGGPARHRFASTTPSIKTIPKDERTSSPPPSRPFDYRSAIRTGLLAFLFLGAGFAMAAAPAAPTISGLLTPPRDAQTLSLYTPSTPTQQSISQHIDTHPLVLALRKNPALTESRPHMKIPAAMRPHNLTGGVLSGSGRIEVPPLCFQDASSPLPSLVSVSYLGPDLCGHPGIVHGGLLATLLDEGLARTCFPALPNKVGVTASLKVDYRAPCPAGSYVVLRAQTIKVEGRKAWVKGSIELLDDEGGRGTTLVEAEALFVEPKSASKMPKIYSSS